MRTVVQRLKKGNERFVKDKLDGKLQDSVQRELLQDGQEPFAIILSCADSRVVPELVFDTGLGELFTVRVAGNIANTCSIASIEYAVANLGTKVIIVLGHESCGAVGAALSGGDNGYNLNHLLAHIVPALHKKQGEGINEVVKENAKINADLLRRQSEIIRDAVEHEKLAIVPAYYNLGSGKVDFFEPICVGEVD